MLLYFSKLPTQINKSPMMENHKDNDIEFDPESSQFVEPLDNPDVGPTIISSVSKKEVSLLVLRKIFKFKLMY